MIVALNNKCNLTKSEYKRYIEELNKINCTSKLVLCPTFLNLSSELVTPKFQLGAQNVSINDKGAFTGEIAASQLKSYNVEYCLVGHSERRIYQKETNEEISLKVERLLKQNITPILCVGESKEERDNSKVRFVLRQEIETATKKLTQSQRDRLIIAYEPIWSIGTGIIPENEEIKEAFQYIKEILPNTKVLYGGSANEKNIDTLKEVSIIDGFLLGGLSLKPKELNIFLEKLEN